MRSLIFERTAGVHVRLRTTRCVGTGSDRSAIQCGLWVPGMDCAPRDFPPEPHPATATEHTAIARIKTPLLMPLYIRRRGGGRHRESNRFGSTGSSFSADGSL